MQRRWNPQKQGTKKRDDSKHFCAAKGGLYGKQGSSYPDNFLTSLWSNGYNAALEDGDNQLASRYNRAF
jgi:hypothetical protein